MRTPPMAATRAEPAVLVAAKETLYPDLETSSNQYAVTETQFTTPTGGSWVIPDDLRRRLEPYKLTPVDAVLPV